MSQQAEIGQPEGRTQYSDFAEERYNKQRDGGGPLFAGKYAQVVHGYLREWVCMGQCNLYIAAAKDPELKEVHQDLPQRRVRP